MLQKVYIKNKNESHSYFNEFLNQIDNSTWVVSDLTSKLVFQNKIFNNQSFVADDSLMRAQELWQSIFKRIYSDYKVVSKETLIFIIKSYIQSLDPKEFSWAQREGVAKAIFNYLNLFSPIHSNKNGHELMGDYFKNQVEAYERWGHWYLLSKSIFDYVISQKIVVPQWIVSVLLNTDNVSDYWDRDLYFDLSAQILPTEIDLISELSKKKNIYLLIPKVEWNTNCLKVYQENISKSEFDYKNLKNVNFKRFPTQLAEAQFAISQIRQWIKSKTPLNKIIICAPDIGKYWPMLSCYLNIENIPSSRGVYSNYKSLLNFQDWISQIHTHIESLDFYNLAISIYSNSDSECKIKFEEFESLLKNIYSKEELKLVKNIEDLKSPHQKLNSLNFIIWALQFWKSEDTQLLQNIIQKVYYEIPIEIELSFQEWAQVLESLCAKHEVTCVSPNPEGIHCLDIVSVKDVDYEKLICLGLSDQELRKKSNVLVQEFDISYLRDQYGFNLPQLESSDLEFELEWIIQDYKNLNSRTEINLCFSDINFLSQHLSPSKLWFLGNLQNQANESNQLSSFFESNLVGNQQYMFNIQESKYSQRLLRDINDQKYSWFDNIIPEKLSASQIEDYLNCPFINAAKKLFKLTDLPSLDLDIDVMTRGNLLHEAAELILKNKLLNATSEDIYNLIDKLAEKYKSKLKLPHLWSSQRVKYFTYLNKFILFENNLRKSLPEINSVFLEKDFQVWIDIETAQVHLSEKPGAILLRGRLDRVDMDSKKELGLIIDYKFDSSQYKNFDSWIKENQIQLLLYMYVIEQGALGQLIRAIGAQYYGFKTATREKGFLDKEFDGLLFLTDSKKNGSDSEYKNELYNQLKEVLKKVINGMTQGDYEPQPNDIKKCHNCDWNEICRAAHLN